MNRKDPAFKELTGALQALIYVYLCFKWHTGNLDERVLEPMESMLPFSHQQKRLRSEIWKLLVIMHLLHYRGQCSFMLEYHVLLSSAKLVVDLWISIIYILHGWLSIISASLGDMYTTQDILGDMYITQDVHPGQYTYCPGWLEYNGY